MSNNFQGFVDAINDKRHANGLQERAYDANWEGAIAAIQELNYGFVDVGEKPTQYEYTYAEDGTTITGVYKARVLWRIKFLMENGYIQPKSRIHLTKEQKQALRKQISANKKAIKSAMAKLNRAA